MYLNDPWDIAEGEYLLDKISECMEGFQIKKIYASNGLNSKKINSAMEDGVGIVVFEGAGNHHLWATHEKDNEKWIYYYELDIMQLKNKYKPIILTSGARLGQFNRTRECFNWFFVSKGKAVATIGPTGLCWIGHGKNVTEMFLGNLHIRLCSEIGKAELLGDAWGDAITQYLCNFSWRGVAKAFHMKAVEETEIFGDPTLKIGGHVFETNFNRTLHVGGDGPNNYTKIQNAINNASDGDIIVVHSGLYNENLFINKSLAIFGRDAKIKTEGIFLYAPKIKIEGFSIEGYNREDGIVCYGESSSIKNNVIYSFNTSIMVYGNGCVICENEIKNSECGIWLDSSCNSEIWGNKIHNNWYGLWSEDAENTHAMNNNFSYNEWYAMWIEGKNGNISNNSFYCNWYSIYLYNSLNFFIYSNKIKRNIHGPQFVNSSFNSFLNNNVERNEHYGIYFGWRSKENVITKNNFIENAQNARDDGKNWFNINYWDDYIGLKIKILAYLHLPYYIPKFSFDWNPQLGPYEI
ncbi:MAG TPA: hypothetical protein ENI52_04440 [Thermoplasmata archaeon]|nr:hypothetical protein [Thermoplasmata archaeon]